MAQGEALPSPNPPSTEPGTILIQTRNLIIRRWCPSDAPALAMAANHTSITQSLRNRFPSPYRLSDAEHYLSSFGISSTAYPTAVAILLKPGAGDNATAEPLLIGGSALQPQSDVYYRTWELGYWLTPSAWGKGYATEFVRAVVPWAFETWPRLNRIEAMVFAKNGASRTVLQRCGFVEEGMRRGAVEKKGEVLDELIFGILRGDLEQ